VNSTPVLIVDDDASIRELMATALRCSGFGAVTAINGADALRYLRAGGDACVILLDLMMPVMDGFEFRREQLRDPRLASIPVVVLSTMASSTRAFELRGCTALDKPTDVFQVAEVVRHSARSATNLEF
jgi:CheY-like chemotaxis protein